MWTGVCWYVSVCGGVNMCECLAGVCACVHERESLCVCACVCVCVIVTCSSPSKIRDSNAQFV